VRDVWHLHDFDWLRELSSEETAKLRAASKSLGFARGETVFAPATHPHSLYLLEEGLVRIYRISEEGSETTFGYVVPGEVFGELAAFGDYPRESFAQAVQPSRVWRIPSAIFEKLVSARPGFGVAITRQIGARLKRIESRVENLVFRNVRQRVAQILLELMEDFGRADNGSGRVLDVDLTQSELATLVGSTRQSVNASLRELESEGLLGRSGKHIVVRDPAALRRASHAPGPL
jgi:CRP/FNR family cyclic AMP-dependent transcriptional regulator